MYTNAISHPRAITTIREPIHGAIDLTSFEREVIDSPYFQRLHFILQNSTTYTAYPSNKNSRFVHSIGVASVVGDLFTASLRNAPKDELCEFLMQASNFMHEHMVKDHGPPANMVRKRDRLIKGWKQTIYGHSGFSHRSFIKTSPEPLCQSDQNDSDFCHFEINFLVDTLWEACRICGLIHDIGHLPMSHSFEMALTRIDSLLDQYPDFERNENSKTEINDDKIVQPLVAAHHGLLEEFSGISKQQLANFLLNDIAVHERRSLRILQYIWEHDSFGCNDKGGEKKDGEKKDVDVGPYRDLIFSLATLILYASSTDKLEIDPNGASLTEVPKFPPFIRTLKTIIAGEVDGDRMDYTIRDGHACGSEIGSFDIQRIISNAVLRKHDDKFRVMYYERAISGLEHFFTQRHDGYKYLIYHRTSSRTEACLQELLGRLLHAAVIAPTSKVAEVLKQFGYIEISENQEISGILPFTERAMVSLDDANLRTMFMILRNTLEKCEVGKDCLGLSEVLIWPIQCLLDIVTVRNFSAVMSPYKNVSMEQQLLDQAKKLAKRNKVYKLFVGKSKEDIADMLSDALSSSSEKTFTTGLRTAFSKMTKSEGVLLVSFQKPKVFNAMSVSEHDWLYVVEHSGNIVPLVERSPLLNNMWDNLKRSSGVSMAIVSRGVKKSADKMDGFRLNLNTVLLDALIAYQADSAPSKI